MLIYKTTEISKEIAELRFQKPDFGIESGNGIRVILVVARKGGAGKSTLCRALASAAVARGETVTLFDTDISRSCHDWSGRAQAAGNWSPMIDVIHCRDVGRVVDTITEISAQPDQEHLILIDTPAGACEVTDQLTAVAHQIICPMLLSRADLNQARATASWYLEMKARSPRPNAFAVFTIALSRVPLRISETEKTVAAELFATLPVFENFLGNRSSFLRMDEAGLLGPMAERLQNRGVATHLLTSLREAEDLLAEIDAALATRQLTRTDSMNAQCEL